MKTKIFVSILILASLIFVMSVLIVGCKKQPQTVDPNQPASGGTSDEVVAQKWTCPMHPEVISDKPGECPECGMNLVPLTSEKDVNTMGMAMSSDIEQTMCPVSPNNPVDKNVWTEYKGKKVYFCCADCKAKFEKEPEKYLSNLPQFSK